MNTKLVFLIALCFALTSIGHLSSAILPTLPQIYIDTKYDPPEGGKIISISTSAAFQAALQSSKLGDIIELQAGVTYNGPFTLPNKTTGTGWIYIRSSDYSGLPAPCNRVSPADAVNMPKIVAATAAGLVIGTASKAHHFRFVGIEIAPTTNSYLYNVVNIGNGEKLASDQPNNIVFDRCYIHGDPNTGSRRGVLMNGAYVSVIDSYVSDCKEEGADSQALAMYSGTGPIKIVNNYLEGAGENVIFGGSDPSIPNAVPSDIEIRCNLFFKPLKWMNEKWSIKNLLEFKNAQRVLVEGNRLENCWPQAQNGFALLFTPRNQNNTAPWSVVQDITFRFNTFVNVAQGLNLSGYDAPNKSERTSRILIQNNVLNVTNLGTGGDGRMFQILNGSTDVILDHNTGFCTNAYLVADGKPKTDFFVFKNNLISHGVYGFVGSGMAYANTTLAAYFNPNWEVVKNADIGGSATNYPIDNYFPKNNVAVGFVDFAGGDYRLTASSPYKALGTDGKDLGADIDSIAILSVYKGDGPISVRESNPQVDVVLYPQPADNYMRIQTDMKNDLNAEIIICDLLGNTANSTMRNSSDQPIDTSKLPNGIYILIFRSEGSVAVRKFIVLH